jgi:hypothetical protein
MDLRGDWHKGGWLYLFFAGAFLGEIYLSAPRWSVIAKLFLKAIESTDKSDSYVETQMLIRLLEQLELKELKGVITVVTIYRLVLAIRRLIAKSSASERTTDASPSSKPFEDRLLQSVRKQGYRIGLPPENLSAVIGGRKFGAKYCVAETTLSRAGGEKVARSNVEASAHVQA